MSFSTEQKAEIMKQQMKNFCCRKAFLHGVLASKAEIRDGLVTLNVENEEYAAFIAPLVRELFGSELTVSAPRRGGRCKTATFESTAAEKFLTDVSVLGADMFVEKCSLCRGAFLRGIFFATGRLSSPEKEYLLEFSLGRRSRMFAAYFESIGLYPKRSERQSETLLYFKNSTMIEDFFALAGLNSAAFALMNSKINGEFRNNANRVANCETNNIQKAVNSSMKQIAVLEELDRAQLLSSLPEELERTARLRMEHRDLSLSQLAAISVPPISKSGLSHRLSKIMELAKKHLASK